MKTYGRTLSWVIGAWFALVAAASVLGVFQNATNRVGLPVAIAASLPLITFSLWYLASKDFRQFALGLDIRKLTAMQAFRVVGLLFVILAAYDKLPNYFAIRAGYGDLLIGVTALPVAWTIASSRRRAPFIAWTLLGMADLILAVALGVTAGLFHPEQPSMYLMTVLPMSLVPTFFVPLLFILHVISIAQARRWNPGQKRISVRVAESSYRAS